MYSIRYNVSVLPGDFCFVWISFLLVLFIHIRIVLSGMYDRLASRPSCLVRSLVSNLNYLCYNKRVSIVHRIGRRPVYICTLILVNIVAVATSFAPNYTAYAILRFFAGVFNVTQWTVGFVISTQNIIFTNIMYVHMLFQCDLHVSNDSQASNHMHEVSN